MKIDNSRMYTMGIDKVKIKLGLIGEIQSIGLQRIDRENPDKGDEVYIRTNHIEESDD